ncbi:hypothetical protein BZG25_12710 [Salinivibrio sp. ML198]|uniref:Uncharacterized protein n=1 Tax=Salinivibrio siamensis TaxID=414286 RepID=A0ABX3K710_9GAMM|nr:hypothetical protein BZG25_12710 [Salinivibrio sp. ML198]OOE83484.1 hypothetical protein BZG73_11540 [Salinivibrio siamensis]
MIHMYRLIASFRVAKRFCQQFYLTKNDGVVDNVTNTPTKPMHCKLKLSGLFSAYNFPQLAICFAPLMEAN